MSDLTVVIPSLDAGPRLRTCLASLAAQVDADGRFDVVVVDDGSQPAVTDLPPTLGSAPLRVVRRETPGGIAVARNAGWQVAGSRICLFLDDDIVADPRLVASHLAAHEGQATRLGIGRLVTQVAADADPLAKRFAASWRRHVAAVDEGRPPRATDCYGGDLSIPTDVLRDAGGFDPSFARSEDIELAARLIEEGAEPVWVPGESIHHERKTGPDLVRDARRNGAFAPRLVERHPRLLTQTEAGAYAAFGQRQLALRRVLTRTRPDPARLGRLIGLVPAGRSGSRGVTTVAHHAYWTGLRTGVDAGTYRRMTDGAAILMYHGFAPAGTRASRYIMPIDRFEGQLRGLLDRGHRPISLDDYLATRRSYGFPPERSFVVTIDDAYAEVESLAAPVLQRLGIPATVFVVADRIGGRNDWDPGTVVHGRPVLDADGLDRLHEGGIRLGAHGRRHVALAGLAADQLEAEVTGSVEALTARFGPLSPAFAYPYGSVDDAARGAVRGAGLFGLGVREGLACPASPDDLLPRIEVRGEDPPWRVALAARLGGTRRLVRP